MILCCIPSHVSTLQSMFQDISESISVPFVMIMTKDERKQLMKQKIDGTCHHPLN